MGRQISLALLSLMPAHGPDLPAPLVDLASSLLAQSRHRASTLKAEEEVARLYACANIACDRLKTALNLPTIEPRPPIPPRIYKRLYTHLDHILPNTAATPRPAHVRASAAKHPELGPPSSTGSRSAAWRPITDGKSDGLSLSRSIARPDVPKPTLPAVEGRAHGTTSRGLHAWIKPVIRYLCNALGHRKLSPSVLAGVEFVLASGGTQERDAAWAKLHIIDLVAALHFFVIIRARALTSGTAIDRRGYVPLRNEILTLLRSARDQVVVTGIEKGDDWEGWTDLKPKDFDAAVAHVNGTDWLAADWYKAIVDIVSSDSEADVEMAHTPSQDVAPQAPAKRADTMLQEEYDLLSEKRRSDYKTWKAKMMSRIDRAMAANGVSEIQSNWNQ